MGAGLRQKWAAPNSSHQKCHQIEIVSQIEIGAEGSGQTSWGHGEQALIKVLNALSDVSIFSGLKSHPFPSRVPLMTSKGHS